MLNKEQKQFALRPARKTKTVFGLHNTVLVYRNSSGYVEYGLVQFHESLVIAVGSIMPQGVSEFNPAFLQVHFDLVPNKWIVSACYVNRDIRKTLWETDSFPTWLNALKKVEQNGYTLIQNPRRSGKNTTERAYHDAHRQDRASAAASA